MPGQKYPVPKDESDDPTAREALDRMSIGYLQHGLNRHPDKGCRRAFHETVWGAEVDGIQAWASAPIKKMLGLCSVTAETVARGIITVRALESIIGSWGSAILLRRRFLSLIDISCDAMRGRHLDDILLLSPQVKNELTTLVILAPFIRADLR